MTEYKVGVTSVCQNCGKPIYFGSSDPPQKKYLKTDDSWKSVIWRHDLSQSAMCDQTFAVPSKF